MILATGDEDLYSPNLNIVSSGLVRRKTRLGMLCAAEDFDVVLVDEAHYASRQNPRDGTTGAPKYGDLYVAMQRVLRKNTKSLWMATATPMQIDDITLDVLLKDRSVQDLEWEEKRLGTMLEKLNAILETPSKMQMLLHELDRRERFLTESPVLLVLGSKWPGA